MGNICTNDSEKSLTRDSQTDFKAAHASGEGRGPRSSSPKKNQPVRGKKIPQGQRLYNDSLYDPVNIEHDPDIVSKNPFEFEREQSLFRPGTTKRSKLESIIQPLAVSDFAKYDHGSQTVARNDNTHFPSEREVQKAQAMNKISEAA